MASACSRTVELMRLGRIPYAEARRIQEARYRALRSGQESAGALMLLEHPDTIAVGRAPGSERDLLAPPERLAELGVEMVRADRGGRVTWHGPGQLVAYVLLPLKAYRKDVGWYLRSLERMGVGACSSLGVKAFARSGMTGVWTESGKVGAIGVGVGGWVSYHGMSLNCDVDLSRYDLIVPCGLCDRRVTSLSEVAGRRVAVDEAAAVLVDMFVEVFGVDELAPARKFNSEEVRA